MFIFFSQRLFFSKCQLKALTDPSTPIICHSAKSKQTHPKKSWCLPFEKVIRKNNNMFCFQIDTKRMALLAKTSRRRLGLNLPGRTSFRSLWKLAKLVRNEPIQWEKVFDTYFHLTSEFFSEPYKWFFLKKECLRRWFKASYLHRICFFKKKKKTEDYSRAFLFFKKNLKKAIFVFEDLFFQSKIQNIMKFFFRIISFYSNAS